MIIDHVGSAFFPHVLVLRIIGRLAYPLFCYCMSVGLFYTQNIWRYLARLAVFALLSQPLYVLAFGHEFYELNIMFSLFVNLLGAWAFLNKKWPMLAAVVVLLGVFEFDYDYLGLTLMLIFCLCRDKRWLGLVLFILCYIPSFIAVSEYSYYALHFEGYSVKFSAFALLAAPLIFINTNTKLKVNRWFFYIFYPAHMLLIAFIKGGFF